MDFGAGDVVAGIKLALVVYEVSCVYENRADVRYRNFVNEIRGFRELLIKLLKSLEEAHGRYERGGLLSRVAHNPFSKEFEEERCQIIGPFEETLEECRLLLEKHKKLQLRNGTMLDNIAWHTTQQDLKIDDLRRRLHMHSTKIKLVIDRLSIKLLTNIDAKIDDLLDVSERNLNLSKDIQIEIRNFYTAFLGVLAGHEPLAALETKDPHVASELIQVKFEQNLLVYAPDSMKDDIPLREGFDALLTHFEQSFEGQDQTPEKYLSLLKTRWLLGRLQKSQGYQMACPGYYYKRAISQFEQAILLRVRGSDIIAYDDGTLNSLPQAAFMIWQPPEQEDALQLDPTVARANEQEVIRLPLASSSPLASDSVMVFRQSTDHFRVVLETTTADGRGMIVPKTFYTEEDKLIPRYGLPTMVKSCAEIAMFSRNEETLYRFRCMEDLFAFQTALTGYEVSHDQDNITCQFTKGSAAQLDCKGRIQLWQESIPPVNVVDSSSAGSPIESFSTQSPRSRQSSFVESIGAATTLSRVGEGFEAENVKSLALTIFTDLDDKAGRKRFCILFIELDTGFVINPKSCRCHYAYDKCPYLCLERKNKDAFRIRVSFTDLDSTGNPNPNTFNLLPFRLPRDSQFDDLDVEETKYVLLAFRSLEEKKTFHKELNLRFKVLSQQVLDLINVMHTVRRRENRPVANPSATKDPARRQSSITSISFPQMPSSPSLSSPPQLGMPELESGFAVAFGFGGASENIAPSQRAENRASVGAAEVNAMDITPIASRPGHGLSGSNRKEDASFEKPSDFPRGDVADTEKILVPPVLSTARTDTWSTQSSINTIVKPPSSGRRLLNKLRR